MCWTFLADVVIAGRINLCAQAQRSLKHIHTYCLAEGMWVRGDALGLCDQIIVLLGAVVRIPEGNPGTSYAVHAAGHCSCV